MIEKTIEQKLRKKVKGLGRGAMCLKFESPGFNGVPDRIILLPGAQVIFAETKKPGEKERARQEYVQGLLRDLGFKVWSTVDSLNDIEAIIKECEEAIQREELHTTQLPAVLHSEDH